MSIKRAILLLVGAGILGSILYLESTRLPGPSGQGGEGEIQIDLTSKRVEDKANRYENAYGISTPDGFVNTEGITVEELIGKKVILIDFWTYSCINCQRTLPYLNAWHEKYSDMGLEIIGVHTPEFEFEKDYDNVVSAVEKFGVNYPVVLDNDFSTWFAYRNRYWPRKYLIDIDGFIVYDHIGEGGYDETERKIQELLEERATVLGLEAEMERDIVRPEGVEEVSRFARRSPEIYFGAWRNDDLGNGTVRVEGIQSLLEPTSPKLNTLYLSGTWEIKKEFAENTSRGAKITFRYQAEKVFFVASSLEGVNIRILRDGVPLGDEAGEHVTIQDGVSSVFIQEAGLYRLIEDPEGSGEHTLEIIIEGPGLEAFTFTFG